MKHGWRNSKKNRILALSFVLFVLLTGFAFYKPKLINANKPFIELSGSIGTSIGNAQKAYDYEYPKEDPVKPTTTITNNTTPTPEKVETKTQIDIVVSCELVFVDNNMCNDMVEAESVIRKKEFETLSFVLIDDYAESKTYKKVEKILVDSGKKYTLKVKE